MSNPINQHFLPAIYINNFSFNEVGDTYVYKSKSGYPNERIKVKNKAAICYRKHLYTIRADVEDKFYIEKEKFDYENSFLKEISNKIDNQKSINSNDARSLIKMLLSIKERNLHLYKIFNSKEAKKYMIENAIDSLNKYSEKVIFKYGKENTERIRNHLEGLLRSGLEEKFNDQDQLSDLQNNSLLKFLDGNNSQYNKLLDTLCKKKFYVYTTTTDNPFISCDNPGFTIHNGNLIGNMSFGSAQLFVFPLSPLSTILINLSHNEDFEPIIKKINYTKSDDKFVDLVNKTTVENCVEIIFSSNKITLSKYKN